MAQENEKFLGSWGFLAFAGLHGKPQLAPMVNNDTGEEFTCVVFTHPTKKQLDENGNVVLDKYGKPKPLRTIVHFSRNLGALSPAEIGKQKEQLQVIQMPVEPEVAKGRKAKGIQVETFVLCRLGESQWVDIPLD